MRVALLAQTMGYLRGGGHFWVYLNWALGFLQNGCEVLWIETIDLSRPPEETRRNLKELAGYLEPFGLAACVRVRSETGASAGEEFGDWALGDEDAGDCDLLFNFRYSLPAGFLRLFRRTALLDIDPGLMQYWVAKGAFELASHTRYFSISDRVGAANSGIPDLGKRWHPVFPCVSLEHWPVMPCPADAPFTTVTHWWAEEYVEDKGEFYDNTKRSAFLPYFDLPRSCKGPLELAACYHEESDREEMEKLRKLGWRVRHSHEATGDPTAYRRYIQHSRGEFSVCKPAYSRMASAWVSDRTVCYLASGKPSVVQFNGESPRLPEGGGLWRFRDREEAARHLNWIEDNYSTACESARALAGRLFCSKKNAALVLDVCAAS